MSEKLPRIDCQKVTAYPPAGLGAMTRPERAQMTGCIVRQPLSNLREGSG